uniref:C-type lectin domain-containing protein n=1 Tax=Oryzias latipes TaxID=8090 RepID=A0A3P9HM60_ORYLA
QKGRFSFLLAVCVFRQMLTSGSSSSVSARPGHGRWDHPRRSALCLRCPGLDWLEFGEFCYKPFGDRKTWQDAQRVCRDLGAELVSIMSMKEQHPFFFTFTATNNLWTGLNDLLVPGMFTWSDDFEVTFTYWAPGEPNNHNGFSEDCVEMLYETGRWNDKSWVPPVKLITK